MRMHYGVVICLLGICMLLTAGCTEETLVGDTPTNAMTPVSSASGGGESASHVAKLEDIEYRVVKFEKQWQWNDLDSPYWECVVLVSNTGNVDLFDVKILVKLTDTADGSIRDMETQVYTRFNAGENKQFTKKLYGDTGHSYIPKVDII